MLSSSKFRRIKNREERKAEKERNLLSLKQSSLPVFEPNTRTQLSKCSSCSNGTENYNINFEWLLEPIDVLKENKKGFFGRHTVMRKILSLIMRALVVEPTQIKIIKHLQEQKSNVPVIVVLTKSAQMELDQSLIKFIFEAFNFKVPTIASTENDIREALKSRKIIIISEESHIQIAFDVTQENEIYWLPVSIAYEIQDSTPFSFTPYGIFQKMRTGYGLVKVSFHEPYTNADFFQRRTPNSNFVRDHLYHDIVFKAPVMASHLIAFLLLTHFNKGGKIEEMSAKVNDVRKEMCTIDFAFEGDAIDVIEHSLEILKEHIIIDNEGIIAPRKENIEKLKDYARVLLFHHALKSVILSGAMYLKSVDPFIDYNKMMNCAADLCDVLSDKIPFRGCASINDQLIEAFDNLSINDLLKKPTITLTEKEQQAQKLAKYFDDDKDDYDNYGYSYDDEYDAEEEEEEELDPNNQVIINIDKQEEINVVKGIILLIQGNDIAEGVDDEI
jgi:hypothetical protein